MRPIISSFIISIICCCSFVAPKGKTYVGSTPAGHVVREFLGISLADSIDFIRWKLLTNGDNFQLQCQYGIGKPNTAGFIDEKRLAFTGEYHKIGSQLVLKNKGKEISIIEINNDILHFLDQNDEMLIGNGGFSYALNNTSPRKTDEFSLSSRLVSGTNPVVYVGRTPCTSDLDGLSGLKMDGPCYKLKWRIILHYDSVTGKPSHYFYGGNKALGEAMKRGRWQMVTGKNGRIIYQVFPENNGRSFYLVKGDENILFFADANLRLLVGDEDFSFTLNRREE